MQPYTLLENPSNEAQYYAATKVLNFMYKDTKTKVTDNKSMTLFNLVFLAVNSFFLYQDPSRVFSAGAVGFHLGFVVTCGIQWYFSSKFLKNFKTEDELWNDQSE